MIATKTDSDHSVLAPSSSSRWSQCAGSVRHTLNAPNTTNPMATRGSDIHQLGEMMLKGELVPKGVSIVRDGDRDGMFWANQDLIEEARNYADFVKAKMSSSHSELFVESKVDIFPEFDLSGHVDACVITENKMYVIDLKTGRMAVSAENNSQMLLYALGLFEEHEMFYDIESIELCIVQDNAMISNTNSWECSIEELLDFKDWIKGKAYDALQEDSECTPSEKACQWCAHSGECKALFDYTNDIITGEFEDIDAVADTDTEALADVVSLEAVTNLLKHKKMIENLFKAYEQRLTDKLIAGEEVDGYKLVLSTKRKKWVDEHEAYQKLDSWFKKDEFEEFVTKKLITPTKAIQLLKGELTTRKENIFAEMWEQPDGDVTLAQESDKRKAYTPPVNNESFEEL